MSKFNAIVLTATDGTQVHFVTQGRAKLPTMDKIVEYFNENDIYLVDLEKEKDWIPPNERVFLTDLRSGLVFCSNKYGVAEETIESYVRRMAPHITSSFLHRRKEDA